MLIGRITGEVPPCRGQNDMGDAAVAYEGRLRDLEAEAFRTGRTLAEHSEQLATLREQQDTASSSSRPLPNTRLKRPAGPAHW